MLRVIKQYGVSILLLIVAIFCIFNISFNLTETFTVVTNSLALFLAIVYFVNFEKEKIDKVIHKLIKSSLNTSKFQNKKKGLISLLFIKIKQHLLIIIIFLFKKRWEITSYLFLLLLLIITLGQFDFLKKFIELSWIKKYQTIIIVLAVVSGGLTMWHNRKKVEKEIEEEKDREEKAEQKRKDEFGDKFPKINKIPVLRNLVKWMYKEGWEFSIFIVLLALLFVIIKIGIPIIYTGSYIDEYNHILSIAFVW